MTTIAARAHGWSRAGFTHEALFYAGDEDFLDRTTSFLRDGFEADEPALVVVNARKADLLRDALGPDADAVAFEDMDEVGRNPARIIPAWRSFVDARAGDGRQLRGVGEPAWPERTEAELRECQRHELLLNVAFSDEAFRLLCPYDTAALPPRVVDDARRTHPFVWEDGRCDESRSFAVREPATLLADHLGPAPSHARAMEFSAGSLNAIRRFVWEHATRAGADHPRASEMVVAVNELATNSVRHGGGRGTLRAWHDEDHLVCEVSDTGRLVDPLAGRTLPSMDQPGGRGLWMVNQLCDLVELCSSEHGTVIRARVRLES